MNEKQKGLQRYLVQDIWNDLHEYCDVESYSEELSETLTYHRGYYWIEKWDKFYRGGKEDIFDAAFMDPDQFKFKQSLKMKEEQRNPFFGKSYKDEIADIKIDLWKVVKDHPFIVELMTLIDKYESEFTSPREETFYSQ